MDDEYKAYGSLAFQMGKKNKFQINFLPTCLHLEYLFVSRGAGHVQHLSCTCSWSCSFLSTLQVWHKQHYRKKMTHWFHRNPLKATAPVSFNYYGVATTPAATKICK